MQITFDINDPISVLSVLVPGFVFIMVYKFFEGQRINKFEGVTVGSITISVLLNAVVAAFKLQIDKLYIFLITIAIAIFLSSITAIIRNAEWFNTILKKIWHTTGRSSIWREIIDNKKGTKVRFLQLFNGLEYEIEGIIQFYDYDPNDLSKGSRMAIRNYSIKPTFPTSGEKEYSVAKRPSQILCKPPTWCRIGTSRWRFTNYEQKESKPGRTGATRKDPGAAAKQRHQEHGRHPEPIQRDHR